jgi:hypothetical protein
MGARVRIFHKAVHDRQDRVQILIVIGKSLAIGEMENKGRRKTFAVTARVLRSREHIVKKLDRFDPLNSFIGAKHWEVAKLGLDYCGKLMSSDLEVAAFGEMQRDASSDARRRVEKACVCHWIDIFQRK